MNKYHLCSYLLSRHKINTCLFYFFFHSAALRVLSSPMYTFASYMLYICFLHVNIMCSHVNVSCASTRDASAQIFTINLSKACSVKFKTFHITTLFRLSRKRETRASDVCALLPSISPKRQILHKAV